MVKKQERTISVDNLFNFIDKNHEKLIKINKNTLISILSEKTNKIHLKSNIYHYNLLRETSNQFISEINFKCLRCTKSCCYITGNIGIYKEDLIILKKNNIDISGYVNIDNIDDKSKIIMKVTGWEKILKTVIETNQSKLKCYYYNSKNNSCTIHKYKPLICCLYPFGFVSKLEAIKQCKWILNNYPNLNNLYKFIRKLKSYMKLNIAYLLFMERKKIIY